MGYVIYRTWGYPNKCYYYLGEYKRGKFISKVGEIRSCNDYIFTLVNFTKEVKKEDVKPIPLNVASFIIHNVYNWCNIRRFILEYLYKITKERTPSSISPRKLDYILSYSINDYAGPTSYYFTLYDMDKSICNTFWGKRNDDSFTKDFKWYTKEQEFRKYYELTKSEYDYIMNLTKLFRTNVLDCIEKLLKFYYGVFDDIEYPQFTSIPEI